MHYDFHQLNDVEFEILCSDLLGGFYDRKIDRYKPGKDRGIDAILYSHDGGETIIQCKHYLKSGYTNLLSSLKNEEVNKIKKLIPSQYIFCTSIPLSKSNKEEIKKIFSPYIRTIEDIYGQENLNDLLVRFPEVEKRHYKLWISSTNVLQTVLGNIIHNDIYGRSKHEITQIYEKARKYVVTNIHHEAIKKIEEEGVIIITGEPGGGKTTLAENIALFFCAQGGFEFIYVHDDLTDAEKVYNKLRKQLFFFDDFLGANFLEAIQGKADAHIVKFIERINEDKNKLFILTSRSSIFSQGMSHSQYFGTGGIDKRKYVLSVKNFSDFEKGMILYSHIYFGKLPEEYVLEIKRDENYKKIISHKNFNPRLIEYIVDYSRIKIKQCVPKEYFHYVLDSLNNPKDIWEHPFDNQINSFERALILLITYNSGAIYETELKVAYDKFVKFEGLKNTTNIDNHFELVTKRLTGSFINRNIGKYPKLGVEYTLFNHSIGDFIFGRYNNDYVDKLQNIFCSLHTETSLLKLNSLCSSKLISETDFNDIRKSIDKRVDWQNGDYGICFCYIDMGQNSLFEKKVIKFLIKIINNSVLFGEGIYEIYKLLMLIDFNKEKLDIKNLYFIDSIIHYIALGGEEIRILGKLCDRYEYSSELKKQLINDLENHLYQYLKDNESISIEDYMTIEQNEDGNPHPIIDKNSILEKYEDVMIDEFNFINVSATINNLGISLSEIAGDYYDESTLMEQYKDCQEGTCGRSLDYDKENYHGVGSAYTANNFMTIDDIFGRL